MNTGYIVIDIGTGNTRAGIFNQQGDCLAVERVDTEYNTDNSYQDACSFDPGVMFENIKKVIKTCVNRLPEIEVKGITATSQRQGVVLIDEEGEPFLGLPNIDNRGKEWVETIGNQDLIYRLSGRWAKKYFSAYKLYGLREKRRQSFDKISKIASISDWIGFMLTGELCYEPSQACETLLFDTEKLCFSRQLCNIFGIDMDILPPLKNSGELLGIVNAPLSRALGLTKQVPFIVGGGDTQFAIKGTKARKGDFIVTAGTTTPVTYLTDTYITDPEQRCWIDCHVDPGLYAVETNAGVTGLNYQKLKTVFFPDKSYPEIEGEMDAAKPPKCGCVISTMDFAQATELGTGGFTFQTPVLDLKQSDFAYSILFNMACGVRENIEALEEIIEKTSESLICCGGGFQGDLFPQMVSNLLGKKVVLREGFSQASGLGGVNILNGYFGQNTFAAKIFKEYHPQELNWTEDHYREWKLLKMKMNS